MIKCEYPRCTTTSLDNDPDYWILAPNAVLCPEHAKACTHKCVMCRRYFLELDINHIPFKWGYYAGSWFCPDHWANHIPEPNMQPTVEAPTLVQALDPNRHDPINHPSHYTSHPSGIECIQITEHLNFCVGNAIKYLWRAGSKEGTSDLEDLQKAKWYVEREIARRKSLES